jgi:16S rRNA (cytidine1402-2'-O)-methyltransferase
VLARELTKIHEEFLRGPLSQIAAALKQRVTVKGECTLIVSGAEAQKNQSMEELEEAIADKLAHGQGSLSTIAKSLAQQFGLPRNMIYEKALKMRSDQKKKG